jgi:thiamine kinase-like enzyme
MAVSTSEDDLAKARAAIAKLEFFRSEQPGDVIVTRLGGLTNKVFRVDCNSDSYVLRLPGPGTDDYIDRGLEAAALREAARAGIAPDLVFADAGSGVMVSQFLEARTMSPALFKSVPGAPARAGQILRKLHTSGAVFKHQFDLFGMMDEYLKALPGGQAQLPEGYQKALREAVKLRRLLATKPAPRVACHCDPLADNFLDDGKRMWLVDWEFSGMNDPMWDLADVSVEAGFDAGQDAAMFTAYFGREAASAERGRIAVYKAMCDLLWTLWGLNQHANGNTADDFMAYANRRLHRCKAAMADPGFAALVAAI